MLISPVESFDYIILGAGPSGLTAAYCLAKAGKTILVVDRNSRPGGLSMSYSIEVNNQQHIFDTGPKRFHTDDPIVIEFLHEVLEMDVIGRSTEVYFHNKYYTWPLNFLSLFKFPIFLALKSFADLLFRKKYGKLDQKMFENYIKFRYGKTLYGVFFKPYTEKFLKWPVTDIHSDWASTGINRTVIDSRIKSESLIGLLKNSLLPNKIETKFLYPKEKGFGHFFDVLYQLCLKTNQCKFLFDSEIENIDKQDSSLNLRIKSENFLATKGLVWSGNLNDLLDLIKNNPKIDSSSSPKLNYLNTIFYNFIFKKEHVLHKEAQWLYVSDGNVLICRITCMEEFSKTTTPEGFYNFIVEVTDSQSQPIHFQNAENLSGKILEELKSMKFISHTAQPIVTKIIPIKDTYPIYSMNYKEIFNGAHKQVKEFSKNVHLIGRSGAFWYNNSDHSIRMAIEFANRQNKNSQNDFDHRSYFGGSH